MLCTRCRSLSPQLRRHPVGVMAPPAERPAFRALLCERCGAPAPVPCPHSFPDVLLRLERAGLGIAGPLLRTPAGAA
jgi:hypothetical protein